MKSMKGKIMKKLKTIKPIGYLKQDRVLQVNASDGFVENFLKNPNLQVLGQIWGKEAEVKRLDLSGMAVLQEPDMVDVTDLMKDLEDDIMEFDKYIEDDNKENIGPPPLKRKDPVFAKETLVLSEAPRFLESRSENVKRAPQSEIVTGNIVPEAPSFLEPGLENVKQAPQSEIVTGNFVQEAPSFLESDLENVKQTPQSEIEMANFVPEAPRFVHLSLENIKTAPLSKIDIASFRRPQLSSDSLFDPNLLAAFEQAVIEHTRIEKEFNFGNSEEPPLKVQRVAEEISNPLFSFEEKCPPGGSESVIFYTTSLRGIRKTFEDCNSVRFLLESFRILFYERDVSMHSEFREELWRILDGKCKALPPRLFIKGRYIGGAEEVLVLHEQGKFRPLFDGIPSDRSNGRRCDGCAGYRFVVCFNCSGSNKVIPDDVGLSTTATRVKCPNCNENGLIICPICC